MPLITLDEVSIGFRGPALLDGVSAKVDRGQKIGLLGRNGAGKSTLMKLLVGDLETDAGEIQFEAGLRVERLVQDLPSDIQGPIESVVATGFPKGVELESWEREHRLTRILSEMDLNPQAEFSQLSAGMKRRVLLARALLAEPHVLLLDEPTNHLDIESILWLEDFLARWDGTLLFVTHDRSFLQKLANRIWEIDRGRLFDWSCDYQTFLRRKDEALAAEEKQQALFDKKLAEEEAWIRQGIKARRTRNMGRVRALKAMREERSERRSEVGRAKLNVQEAARSGALVADVQDISFAYDQKQVVEQFSTLIMRGDKIGIIGPNGAGKTTLLKLILGQLQPTKGKVKLGTNLEVAYFDQVRDQLDEQKSAQECVADGNDRLRVGERDMHVIGYLQEFLFTPERSRTQVKFLSGGERNRLLLAKLMTRPANVLVLDEPTNDLDSETLELLEEQVSNFGGTVLLVSHDRAFLNNVVTSTIVFEESGVKEYAGGYDDWQRVRSAQAVTTKASNNNVSKKTEVKSAPEPSQKPRKLTFKEKKELEELPGKIEETETRIAELHAAMADPDYYKQAGEKLAEDQKLVESSQAELGELYARWEELESRDS